MSLSRKVIWNEGMFLSPHHFQQWDRYYQGLVQFRFNSLSSHGWGVITLKIDDESLKNGICLIQQGTGILSDGLSFNFVDPDQPPASRPIEDKFVTPGGTVDVHLAVPIEHAGGRNCNIDSGQRDGHTRFLAQVVPVTDENTGDSPREVLLAQTNLKILFSGEEEAKKNHRSIKVAELERIADNAFKLNATYIPPCLTIAASPHLTSMVKNLYNNLADKSQSLSEKARQKSQDIVDFGTTDVMTFWRLFTVNSFLPWFAHFDKSDRIHPEHLYFTFVQLAGALTTFSIEERASELPAYYHDNLSFTFEQLYEKIQILLGKVDPTNYVEIPLELTPDGVRAGNILDDRLLESAHFYLAVSADIPEGTLVTEVEQNVKIGSGEDIRELISMALRGVAINHEPRPPDPLPIRMGFQYFRLETFGDLWDRVKGRKTIAIYLPDEFPNVKIRLMAVRA
ncbi:MAG: type VI secretion system baseplate subunit TssK [bacterium]